MSERKVTDKTKKLIDQIRSGSRLTARDLNTQVGGGGNGAPLPTGKTGELIKEIRSGHKFDPDDYEIIVK